MSTARRFTEEDSIEKVAGKGDGRETPFQFGDGRQNKAVST